MANKVITSAMLEEIRLQHHGILGMKWGVRRFQNKDGSLTSAGKARLGSETKTKSLSNVLSKIQDRANTNYVEKRVKQNEEMRKKLVANARDEAYKTFKDELDKYPEAMGELFEEYLIDKTGQMTSKELKNTKKLDARKIFDETVQITKNYTKDKAEFDKLSKGDQKIIERTFQIIEDSSSIAQWRLDRFGYSLKDSIAAVKDPQYKKEMKEIIESRINEGWNFKNLNFPDPNDYKPY